MAYNYLPLILLAAIVANEPAWAEPASCSQVVCGEKISLSGPGDPIDGDTIWVGIHKIRLYGIEALEHDQPCEKDGWQPLECVHRTRSFLAQKILNKDVTCEINRGSDGKPDMHHSRYLGVCFVNGTELNKELVRTGWALADPTGRGDAYRKWEELARTKRVGIHQAKFLAPAEFRALERKSESCPTVSHQCIRK